MYTVSIATDGTSDRRIRLRAFAIGASTPMSSNLQRRGQNASDLSRGCACALAVLDIFVSFSQDLDFKVCFKTGHEFFTRSLHARIDGHQLVKRAPSSRGDGRHGSQVK